MLNAIEEDRFDKLPQGLFVRGFVREYARFLGLDEQKILTDLSFHVGEPAVVPVVVAAGDSSPSRVGAGVMNAALVLGGVGLVAALIFVPGLRPKPETATALPPVNAADLATAATPQVALVADNATPGGAQASDPTSSVLPQPLQLTLTATEDCWIGLDVGGDRVENRVLKKGESFSITARQNASLAVGNAGGLLVAIDSGPPRLLGNRGEVRRNIPLSPEAIGALSAGAEVVPTKPIG